MFLFVFSDVCSQFRFLSCTTMKNYSPPYYTEFFLGRPKNICLLDWLAFYALPPEQYAYTAAPSIMVREIGAVPTGGGAHDHPQFAGASYTVKRRRSLSAKNSS